MKCYVTSYITNNIWRLYHAKTLFRQINDEKSQTKQAKTKTTTKTKKILMAKRNQRSKITDRSPEENEAISEKIQVLIGEGFPTDQATAIAFRMFRDGELSIIPFTKTERRNEKRKRQRKKMNQIKEAFKLLGLEDFYKKNR